MEVKLEGFKPTALDELVLSFTEKLERHTPYSIVSGYISILFGHLRPTQDVDIVISHVPGEAWLREIEGEFIWAGDILSPLRKGERVSIFSKHTPWYFDIKKATSIFEKASIEDRWKVVLGEKVLYIAPIELQIAYKLSILGSDKDVKDAAYLFNYFKEKIDMKKLKQWASYLNADLTLLGWKDEEY